MPHFQTVYNYLSIKNIYQIDILWFNSITNYFPILTIQIHISIYWIFITNLIKLDVVVIYLLLLWLWIDKIIETRNVLSCVVYYLYKFINWKHFISSALLLSKKWYFRMIMFLIHDKLISPFEIFLFVEIMERQTEVETARIWLCIVAYISLWMFGYMLEVNVFKISLRLGALDHRLPFLLIGWSKLEIQEWSLLTNTPHFHWKTN